MFAVEMGGGERDVGAAALESEQRSGGARRRKFLIDIVEAFDEWGCGQTKLAIDGETAFSMNDIVAHCIICIAEDNGVVLQTV